MTLSVGFQPIISNEICGICLDSLETSTAIAHTGPHGPKHPWHKDCIKAWIITSGNSQCPSCLVPMNKESLLTAEEKIALKVALIREEIYKTCIVSCIVFGAMGIAYLSKPVIEGLQDRALAMLVTYLGVPEEKAEGAALIIVFVIWAIALNILGARRH